MISAHKYDGNSFIEYVYAGGLTHLKDEVSCSRKKEGKVSVVYV